MYKDANETKSNRRYKEALSLHTGAPTVHWQDRKSYVTVVEAKIVTTISKQIDIRVYFLPELF